MTICRFFVSGGHCKFGDRCKNEHPGQSTGSSRNPFEPLQNRAYSTSSSDTSRWANRLPPSLPYKLDKATVTSDLSTERPQWILSAYGPGKDAPTQLFGGYPREMSFEELRVAHYEFATQGKEQQATQEAQALVSNAEQQIQHTLSNIDDALKYIVNGENEHPNRIDICKAKDATLKISFSNQQPTSSPFRQPSNPAPKFGQLSAPLAFGRPQAPTIGQPPAPASSIGQPSISKFGQPSAFGQQAASGHPAALGRPTTSFGQSSSAFGNPSIAAPTFGQPSAPAFGVPQQTQTPFAGSSTKTTSTIANQLNPFGQPSIPSQPSTFGQSSTPAQSNIFAKPTGPSVNNPFGQPAASASAPVLAPPGTRSSFGTLIAPPATGAVGQPSTTTPGQSNSNQANQSSDNFRWPSGTTTTEKLINAQGANRAVDGISGGQAANGVQAHKDARGKITSWKGSRVSYIEDEPCYQGKDGTWERIWFPDGPPVFTKTVDLPDMSYDQATKDNYRYMKEKGAFKDGIMPELPPRKEWCSWDF